MHNVNLTTIHSFHKETENYFCILASCCLPILESWTWFLAFYFVICWCFYIRQVLHGYYQIPTLCWSLLGVLVWAGMFPAVLLFRCMDVPDRNSETPKCFFFLPPATFNLCKWFRWFSENSRTFPSAARGQSEQSQTGFKHKLLNFYHKARQNKSKTNHHPSVRLLKSMPCGKLLLS